jgi:hypothetical protein
MGDHHRCKGGCFTLPEPGRLTFAKHIPPSEQLLRPETMTSGDSRNHDPVLAALRDDRQLLLVRPIPATFNAADHFDPRPSRGLGFKSTVNLMVKSMDAHGPASCPRAPWRGRCGQSIAYTRNRSPKFSEKIHGRSSCPPLQPFEPSFDVSAPECKPIFGLRINFVDQTLFIYSLKEE